MSTLHLLFSISYLSILTFSSATIFPKEALPTQSGYLPITAASPSPPPPSASALFFAFYEAQHPTTPPADTPLLLWLQGGPGCSSMLGNFFEHGPYLVSRKTPTLHPNPSAWNRLFGVLYVDNPIGTGFSIATTLSDIPHNQSTVAAHLFAALQSFLSSNPSFRARPMYLIGESYGGKYVPAIGHHILQQNYLLQTHEQINLRGAAIGNGLTHPIAQVGTHAASAYFTGLIDGHQRAYLETLQNAVIKLTRKGNWSAATAARTRLLSWIQSETGLATLMDYRRKRPYESETVGVFLNTKEVLSAFGVAEGVVWEECRDAVAAAMAEDVMKSEKFAVEGLLRKMKVLLYQGVFDLMDGVVSTEAWLREVEWEGMAGFFGAERRVWEVDGEVAGHVKGSGNLTHVVVFGAGHLVPADQGRSSQAMVEDWVQEKGLFGNLNANTETTGWSSRRTY